MGSNLVQACIFSGLNFTTVSCIHNCDDCACLHKLNNLLVLKIFYASRQLHKHTIGKQFGVQMLSFSSFQTKTRQSISKGTFFAFTPPNTNYCEGLHLVKCSSVLFHFHFMKPGPGAKRMLDHYIPDRGGSRHNFPGRFFFSSVRQPRFT